MNGSSSHFRSARIWFVGAFVMLAACQTEWAGAPDVAPDRAEISNEISASAVVVAVDAASRLVTLRREDGSVFDILAGENVRNFEQIEVGDALSVRFEERLTASRRPAGEATVPAQVLLAAGRAESGDKPGAGMGVAISQRVRIESIDLANDIVVFSLDSGELIAQRLATPVGRAFVAGLELGDTVQLDYSRAVALTMEEL